MMRIAMSPAAAGLFRALRSRAAVERDRILLTEFRSVDWQSLTFVGERHHFQLRIPGPDGNHVLSRILDGLGDDEFAIPGHFVADIAAVGEPESHPDGSATVTLEALTVAED
ncbi:MAG TPA: hypothetical protein VD768_01635 [Sphingomicrobium sp.]|nr:hypothetical protein [Sphingomicrobium sp.]